ncbi:hypothetical protein [Nonomuraea sp. LPB2021202275-12-8]|uniref:hypothetical protein n=1 Tax=Nonomuraea sp. LPB2021202275-12-8 TaxID=3120159 RepID=UPI00300C130C
MSRQVSWLALGTLEGTFHVLSLDALLNPAAEQAGTSGMSHNVWVGGRAGRGAVGSQHARHCPGASGQIDPGQSGGGPEPLDQPFGLERA